MPEVVLQQLETLREGLPQEQGHHTASLASNSPVTDGEHVFAFFGSFGLYCLESRFAWKFDMDAEDPLPALARKLEEVRPLWDRLSRGSLLEMRGGSVTRSSFQGTSSMSISMMRKFGIAAQKWALISVDMWP